MRILIIILHAIAYFATLKVKITDLYKFCIIILGLHPMLSQPDFDCQEINDLCPGEVVQVSCTLNVDQQIFVQQWEVHGCKNKLKIDFNHENNHGDVECRKCECHVCK